MNALCDTDVSYEHLVQAANGVARNGIIAYRYYHNIVFNKLILGHSQYILQFSVK